MRLSLFILLLFSLFQTAEGQVKATTKKESVRESIIINGDTMPHFELKEVPILPPRHFKNRFDERQYWRLVYNLKKVLPYSRLVAATVIKTDSQLAALTTDKERRKFIKHMEDSLWKQYEGDMREMTITQGKLLFKLIDRATANSPYFWIEAYRGSVSAFFWQGIARLFGTNLRSKYDPKGEDKLIEEIVSYIEKGYI